MLLFELIYKEVTYFAHFSHYALTRTEMETGKSFEETIETTEGQEELMYHALIAGCNHQDIDAPDRKDVPFIIDANMAKVEWMSLKSLQAIEEEKKKFGMSLKKEIKVKA
jgi:hypothetical protein